MEQLILTQIPVSELRKILREEIALIMKDYLGQIEQPVSLSEEYLDIEQLSELLHRTVSAIRGLVYRKEIPVMKVGKKLMFERKAINNWLQGEVKKTNKDIEQDAKRYLLENK